ncbi:hypothetical protein BKI52_25110 [marine bacterium AO1-C]|nr:hypothetical protein BKI52_25110 [marine bacterium AO1-C]
MHKLGEAIAQATINANIDSINISEWLFNISSEEYAACAEGHQSAAQGRLPSGKRVSMNVEFVAGFFMVQHYIETISEKDRVLTVSPNTVLWLDDEKYVLLQITWELSLEKIDDSTCTLTCKVTSETENEAFIHATHELTKDIDPANTPFQLHINEEAPLFAKDIEAKALAGVWA